MSYGLRDVLLKNTRVLPNAASTTVNGGYIDLETSTRGKFLADSELLLTVPALTTTMAPDTRTMTYSIITDDNSSFSSATVLSSAIVTQTGAGGVGASATTARFRIPTNTERYVGVRIVSGASTTDSSTLSATLELLV